MSRILSCFRSFCLWRDGGRLSASRKLKKNPGICALCGSQPATTRDHLPPQGIYPKELRNGVELYWVPACKDCNGGSSPEDECFKVQMGFVGAAVHQRPEAFGRWVAGTVGHNKKIAHQIFSTATTVLAPYRSAIIEPAVQVTFDAASYKKVICRIIKGLYWRETTQVMSLSSKITVIHAHNLEPTGATSWRELMDLLPARFLNGKMFCYKCKILEDGSSYWGMQFFGAGTVFGIVKPETVT
jgi:hypothetical protein